MTGTNKDGCRDANHFQESTKTRFPSNSMAYLSTQDPMANESSIIRLSHSSSNREAPES